MNRANPSPIHAVDTRLRVVTTEPGTCGVGVANNLMIAVWWWQATGSAVQRLFPIVEVLNQEYPQGYSHIHIVKDKAPIPTSEARAGFLRLMGHPALGHVAVVIGGQGFWASAMRSAITGMQIISPRGFQLRLQGSIREVVAWLPEAHLKRTGVEIESAALLAMLERAEGWLAAGSVEVDARDAPDR
jgi:hypothetical protein